MIARLPKRLFEYAHAVRPIRRRPRLAFSGWRDHARRLGRPKPSSRHSVSWLALLLVFGALAVPRAVSAAPGPDTRLDRDLATFVNSVVNGDGSVLRGVYAPGILALAVVQQPNASFVSAQPDTATQFRMAAARGVVGLLAHNFLAGQDFFRLGIGQSILLVYGDGSLESYLVRHIYRYRATKPESVYSSFVDLDTNLTTDTAGLFNKVYTGGKHVTFQTCITADGNPSWGRLFIVAEPAPEGLPDVRVRGGGQVP